jgi:transposase
MMGPRQVDQAALFYEFSLERHVPASHLLRSIDRFVDLSDVWSHLAPFYSSTGRPSIDPELLVRMLLVGYCYGPDVAQLSSRQQIPAVTPAPLANRGQTITKCKSIVHFILVER